MEAKTSIGLEDIIPTPGIFHLTKKNKDYSLREITLRDQVWIKDTFGKDVSQIFMEMQHGLDYKTFLKIIYHQLEHESKKDFLSIQREEITDNGEVKNNTLYGVDVFGENVLQHEIKPIIDAYIKTFGISQPVYDKLTEDLLKKNPTEK